MAGEIFSYKNARIIDIVAEANIGQADHLSFELDSCAASTTISENPH